MAMYLQIEFKTASKFVFLVLQKVKNVDNAVTSVRSLKCETVFWSIPYISM